jgi:hypothetical protein
VDNGKLTDNSIKKNIQYNIVLFRRLLALMLLTCIHEMLGSNLIQADYPEGFRGFPQSLQANIRIVQWNLGCRTEFVPKGSSKTDV